MALFSRRREVHRKTKGEIGFDRPHPCHEGKKILRNRLDHALVSLRSQMDGEKRPKPGRPHQYGVICIQRYVIPLNVHDINSASREMNDRVSRIYQCSFSRSKARTALCLQDLVYCTGRLTGQASQFPVGLGGRAGGRDRGQTGALEWSVAAEVGDVGRSSQDAKPSYY